MTDSARRKGRLKRGGEIERCDIELEALAAEQPNVAILALHEALERFEREHPQKAEIVKLRYFLGMTLAEAADALDISLSTADRDWRYARAWLAQELRSEKEKS